MKFYLSKFDFIQDAGIYKNEIVPITVKGKKGEQTFEIDEHPKPNTTQGTKCISCLIIGLNKP